ncbi:MAG: 16S rRNA (cytidine(1402)-2'-O)-methyltransferase [Gammaproteobacteria bacterium]|nr:16S rRNA (cytidine(1402)-2'-O)-methyltransferase [Gammaproteobacteria bacterium]TVQ47083.1 MAG: 16S rRNA (cytidine(1402)-2'-O)-methyltransferase [Gammaproteobacteria bacterium]
MTGSTGVLFVVATPIGNLGDLGARARDTLATVDAVAAEDTRRTGQLLSRLGLSVPLVSLHEHNEMARLGPLLARLAAGQSLALVSDAGTPLISDPGYLLVRAALQAGHRVSPVPGACAAVAALSVAGLPTDRFVFEGFLPARQAARRARLEILAPETRTLVFYEAIHRLAETLADLVAGLGAAREATLARELTKLHEQVLHGPLAELAAAVAAGEVPARGECVLVVAGAPEVAAEEHETRRVLALVAAQLPPREAVRLTAAITGARPNRLRRWLQGAPGDDRESGEE